MNHPLCAPRIGLEYARILAHMLNRVTSAPAHVVDDDGHYILVSDDQLTDGWWPRERVIYTADASDVSAL